LKVGEERDDVRMEGWVEGGRKGALTLLTFHHEESDDGLPSG
jgi:hypothetical protein